MTRAASTTAQRELRGLLIKAPYVDWILEGRKRWELRGSATRVRGALALIQSGSGTVVGTCRLVDCRGPLTLEQLQAHAGETQLPGARRLPYRRTFAWVLEQPCRLSTPVPYRHPRGAVIWVRLAPEVAAQVLARAGGNVGH